LEADKKKKAMEPRDTDQSIGYDMYGGAVDESPDSFQNPAFDASAGATHVRGKNPVMTKASGSFNQADVAMARRSSALKTFNRNDYFEYFFRDGASVFISFKAGGIRLENPLPGAMPVPLSLKDINPITGSEPKEVNRAALDRRRSSVEAVQSIMKQSSSVSNDGNMKSQGSFGAGDSPRKKGARRKYSLQFDSFAEGYEDDFEEDDANAVEMGKKKANSKGSTNPLHETQTHSIYDVAEVEGDLVELSKEEKHALKWLDIVRMSEMVYGDNDDYYDQQQEVLLEQDLELEGGKEEEEQELYEEGEGFVQVDMDDAAV
jgi:hypothetical protein